MRAINHSTIKCVSKTDRNQIFSQYIPVTAAIADFIYLHCYWEIIVVITPTATTYY